MFNDLYAALEPPALYQRTRSRFWDDEHISGEMLKAHLDPHWDAASRAHDFIERSAAWIAAIAPPQTHGDLMDLGCGPGLYTARFARMGYRVTGIDLSPRSIIYARSQDPCSRYLCGSYLEWSEAAAYDLITLIYCDYGALTDAERADLLVRARRALRPGGKLILDVFAPPWVEKVELGRIWERSAGGFWCAGEHVVMEERLRYGARVTAQHVVVLVGDEIRSYAIWDTAFSQDDLRAELTDAGFTQFAWADDVSGAPYTGCADTLCVVAS
jgi:SAM-dependent methyltransferase